MRYFNSLIYNKTVSPLANAMITNHLRAPYGVHFTKTSYDSTAPCRRQEESYDSFCQFFRHHTVPGEVYSYYIKFHGARTAYCWVIEGTMTSAGHRLHKSEGHRTIFGNLNRTISTAAGHRTMCEKNKELSKVSIQIGRCPSGHRPMF